jgi:GNAT superfamily N-acetyltransferase
MIALQPVGAALPAGFEVLRAEARAEGFTFLDRLADDWDAGTLRFDRLGEALLFAAVDGAPAGIGGLTLEPSRPDTLRVRRFYVRPRFRRHGVGRALAEAILARAGGRAVTCNSTDGAVAFWESLGFEPDCRDGYTHIRQFA